MPRIRRFEDLDAWKAARKVTSEIYTLSRRGELARDFGLRDQLCRAAVSIMANIAEGFERDGDKEFVSFLSIAKGSAGEVRSLLYVALDQAYLSQNEFDQLSLRLAECSRMIAGLLSYLRQSNLKGIKFR